MLMFILVTATVVAVYWFWIRPILKSRPAFAEFYAREESVFTAVREKLKGIKQKLYREGHQQAFTDEQFEAFRTRIRLVALGMAAAQFEGALELTSFLQGGGSELAIHRVRAVSSD